MTTTSTAWLFKKKQITGDGETLWTTEARCFYCRATKTYVPNTVFVANRPTSGVSITDTIGDCKQPWQFVYGCHREQIETTKHRATIGLGAPRSTGARETQTDIMKYAHPSKYRRGDQHKLLYWHSYPQQVWKWLPSKCVSTLFCTWLYHNKHCCEVGPLVVYTTAVCFISVRVYVCWGP